MALQQQQQYLKKNQIIISKKGYRKVLLTNYARSTCTTHAVSQWFFISNEGFFMTNYFLENHHSKIKWIFPLNVAAISRLDKSPLLANGYNAPPTHLNHMPCMQMGHHGAQLMSQEMPHGLRPHAAAMLKNQNIPGMEAITRQLSFTVIFKLID